MGDTCDKLSMQMKDADIAVNISKHNTKGSTKGKTLILINFTYIHAYYLSVMLLCKCIYLIDAGQHFFYFFVQNLVVFLLKLVTCYNYCNSVMDVLNETKCPTCKLICHNFNWYYKIQLICNVM